MLDVIRKSNDVGRLADTPTYPTWEPKGYTSVAGCSGWVDQDLWRRCPRMLDSLALASWCARAGVGRTLPPPGLDSGVVACPSTATRTQPEPLISAAQEDSFAHLIYEHIQYIRRISGARGGEPLIRPELAQLAMKIWWRLWSVVYGELSVPDASPGPNGELLYVWKRGDHYLSLEMSPEGTAEFFYRNRKTGDIWGLDYNPNDERVPEELVAKLRLFLGNI